MSALLDLAERCAKATGPDRELDMLILEHIRPQAHARLAAGIKAMLPKGYHPDRVTALVAERWTGPKFTESDDVAKKLLPDGEQHGVEYYPWSHHAKKAVAWGGNRYPVTTNRIAAVTTSLAICAVALRLRAAIRACAAQVTP